MRPDVLRGHLEALILAVIEPGPLHGYAIMEALHRRSGGRLDLPTGTIYPALRRLERAGYLRSDWSTVGGRRRRTYELTTTGRRSLADERTAWQDFATTMNNVLRPEPPKP